MVVISSANIVKFDGSGNFRLWKRRFKDVLVHQDLVKVLIRKQPEGMKDKEWQDSEMRAASTIKMCLANKVMYHVMDEECSTTIWLKLESR